MNKTANPQGKGLVPLLDDLAACRARVVIPAKRIDQISRELFTSLFVLQSRFQFRPVVGQCYWLYRREGQFRLSLVSPEQWAGNALFGVPVGECVLHPDLTWTLQLTTEAAADAGLMQLIDSQRQAFQRQLADAPTLAAALPVYEEKLPFYQRALASGLAHSLGVSLHRAGLNGLNYEQALGLIGNGESAD